MVRPSVSGTKRQPIRPSDRADAAEGQREAEVTAGQREGEQRVSPRAQTPGPRSTSHWIPTRGIGWDRTPRSTCRVRRTRRSRWRSPPGATNAERPGGSVAARNANAPNPSDPDQRRVPMVALRRPTLSDSVPNAEVATRCRAVCPTVRSPLDAPSEACRSHLEQHSRREGDVGVAGREHTRGADREEDCAPRPIACPAARHRRMGCPAP